MSEEKQSNEVQVMPPKKVGKPFVKGQSGNPNGRPRIPTEIKERLSQLGPKAVERLAELMKSENERIALAAAQTLVERAYGKAKSAPDEEKRGDAGDTDRLREMLQLTQQMDGIQKSKIAQLEARLADLTADNATPIAAEIVDEEGTALEEA